MKILGIESSCDETAAAIVAEGELLSNVVASQHDVHARFGGVVPELASRRHLENIVPVVQQALVDAGVAIEDVEGVAATYAPGLVGALLVGLSAAKGIALARHIPFIGVNHLEAHLNAIFLEEKKVPYPHVGLIVSGGHTSLYDVSAFGHYRLLGATRDDAVGEAFDKVAKLLDLGFPGGPAIDRLAQEGDAAAFRFTKPIFHDGNIFDFSFSGLKTAVRLTYQNECNKADLAASFQRTAVEILLERLTAAVKTTNAKAFQICGGVAANSELRRGAKKLAEKIGIPCSIPSMSLCTDNAAMIASVGERYLVKGKRSPLSLNAVANCSICESPYVDRGGTV